jgi:hypothetical protein
MQRRSARELEVDSPTDYEIDASWQTLKIITADFANVAWSTELLIRRRGFEQTVLCRVVGIGGGGQDTLYRKGKLNPT